LLLDAEFEVALVEGIQGCGQVGVQIVVGVQLIAMSVVATGLYEEDLPT